MGDFTLDQANKIVGNLRAITNKLEQMDIEDVAESLETLQDNVKSTQRLKAQVILVSFLCGVLCFPSYLYLTRDINTIDSDLVKYDGIKIVNEIIYIPVHKYDLKYTKNKSHLAIIQKP
jgi:hypothetical protein